MSQFLGNSMCDRAFINNLFLFIFVQGWLAVCHNF